MGLHSIGLRPTSLIIVLTSTKQEERKKRERKIPRRFNDPNDFGAGNGPENSRDTPEEEILGSR